MERKKKVISISLLARVWWWIRDGEARRKGRNPRVLEQESLLNESSEKKKKVKWVYCI